MRKKSAKHISWINAGIFPASICFSCGFEYDEIMKHLKKVKADAWSTGLSESKDLIDKGNWFALQRTLTNTKQGKNITLFYLIIKPVFDFSDDHFIKLAHEILHVCQFLLPDILDRNREYECEAYFHSYLMEQCLKILRN